MIALALRNLTRRRLRSGLTLLGVAVAVGVLACLMSFSEGYQRGLDRELKGMGSQMMLVPLGCPYDAAARVLKGKTLDVSLPFSALDTARHDPGVAIAAPMLMAALPRPSEGRTDLWAGIDSSIQPLKPWWKMRAGSRWFPDANSVMLGAEAAATELRNVGDTLYSPETGRRFKVCAILERSGTSDDSLFFIPLATAQAMFRQPDRLTAISIRLTDPTPAVTAEVSARLQKTPGAQVVTLAEMLGTFTGLLSTVRTLVLAIVLVALTISGLSVFNTMLSSVLERTGELGTLRAVGASRAQVFKLLTLEAALITLIGSVFGIVLAVTGGKLVEQAVKQFVPLAPSGTLLYLTVVAAAECIGMGVGIGVIAGLYPAWQASRLQPAQALRAE